METAAYMRVSTVDQKTDLQRDDLASFADRAGLNIARWYEDHATSGRKEGRPGLNELMLAARNREFKCVLVWQFDRFARSTLHLLQSLQEFEHLSIRFVSVKDQIDTDSPHGKLFFTIVGAMAEFESNLISERVKAGIAAARKRGKKLGRPRLPAYVKSEVRRLAVETDLSISGITEAMNGQVGRSTVGKIVKQVRSTSTPTSH